MARSALLIAVFYMVYAMIPILMGQSAGVNFSFPQFRSCNTSDILCVNDATMSRHEVHLTNITNPHYKLTNKTSGRVVYSQTISLSSLDSFTTDFQFVLKYYNHSPNVYPYGGISFFMTSKEMATSAHSVNSFSGLPGNGSLSVGVVAVEFYSNNKVYTDVGGYRPNPTLNYTNLNAPLNDRTLWHARIDYNCIKKYLQIFFSKASNSSMSQVDPILAHPLDISTYLPDDFVVGISASAENFSVTHTILSWSFSTKTKTRKSSKKKKNCDDCRGISLFSRGSCDVEVVRHRHEIAKQQRTNM
ncbi:hypothetical protein SUGI_0575790 [Cryptomeria japonica]|nr:hypothetical protein SUGI_0575790 [Cryptomeria japonica]